MFLVQAIGEITETLFEGTNRTSVNSRCCFIHIKPPLIIDNLLSVPLEYGFRDNSASLGTVEKGYSIQVTEMEVEKNEELSISLKVTQLKLLKMEVGNTKF